MSDLLGLEETPFHHPMSDENTPSVEDIALTCAAVALGGVWMLGGEWWQLGMVLAVVGWCGAIAGLIVRRDR